jgi:hypothetical protein
MVYIFWRIVDFFNNIKYDIYHFPKRNKLKRLFNHYYSFDICEDITNINFTVFKDFYENGELDIIDWESDDHHSTAKKTMDSLYFYVNYFRPKYLKINEHLLEKWDSDVDWGKDTDNEGFSIMIFKNKTPENEKIIDTYHKIEDFLNKYDIIYLHKLIDIKNFLWT